MYPSSAIMLLFTLLSFYSLFTHTQMLEDLDMFTVLNLAIHLKELRDILYQRAYIAVTRRLAFKSGANWPLLYLSKVVDFIESNIRYV